MDTSYSNLEWGEKMEQPKKRSAESARIDTLQEAGETQRAVKRKLSDGTPYYYTKLPGVAQKQPISNNDMRQMQRSVKTFLMEHDLLLEQRACACYYPSDDCDSINAAYIARSVCRDETAKGTELAIKLNAELQAIQVKKGVLIRSYLAIYNELNQLFNSWEANLMLANTEILTFYWSRTGRYRGQPTATPSLENWLIENDPYRVTQLFIEKIRRRGYGITGHLYQPPVDTQTAQYAQYTTFYLICPPPELMK